MIRALEDLPGERRAASGAASRSPTPAREESSGCAWSRRSDPVRAGDLLGGSRLTHAGPGAERFDRRGPGAEGAPETVVDEQGRIAWGGGNDGAARDEHAGALVPELDRVCREIQRLLNYYRSLYPERSYEGILNR
jgi:hypothetical protein